MRGDLMELLEHQKQALIASRGLNRVAYYWDMGLGKTFIGAEKLIDLKTQTNLVVCQKTKIADWMEHFEQNYSDAVLYDLTKKNGVEMFVSENRAEYLNTEFHRVIGFINYDLIFRRESLLLLSGFTLLLDESSLIQNDKAKRSKFILNLHPANVILLSGTPVSGKYENLWSQIHLLGWDISNELYQKQYVNWILTEEDEAGFRHWIVDRENPYKNVDRLKTKLREHGAFFLKTDECFTLPDQTFITVSVPTTKEYRKFRKEKVIDLNNGVVLVGDNVFKERLYSRELCGSFNQKKWDAFNDLLQSTNDRLIVFYNFNKELAGLIVACMDAGKPYSIISGQIKDLTAYENESDSVTLIQYQAGAMGLNLQKANKIIYFTLTDKSELFEQSKKRIHRIGQNQPCFYYLMICKNSVEEVMLEILKERRDFTDELFKERCS